MKKRIVFFDYIRVIGCLLVMLAHTSGHSYSWSAERSVEKKESNLSDYQGILFRISGNGLTAPSYALGTFHTIPGDFVHTLPHFEEMMQSVEQLLCEYDFEAQEKALVRQRHTQQQIDSLYEHITSLYTDRKGRTRSFLDDLSRKQRDGIKGSLYGWGIEDRSLWNFEYLHRNLDSIYNNSLLQLINASGYDLHEWRQMIDFYMMYSIAPAYHLKVIGLDKQNAVDRFSNMQREYDQFWDARTTRKQYSQYLGKLILQLRERYGETISASRSYLRQDMTFMMYLRDNGSSEMKERNEWWLKQIPQLLQDKPSIIVVGIGHLFGGLDYPGILPELEKMGYKIERIK